MPWIVRIVGPGYPHPIVQRGNNKEQAFLDREDYEKYLGFLERYSKEKETSILAYCLMPNHVHLLAKPSHDYCLAKIMQGITLCYTQYFNRKRGRSGRLWECRYHSTVVDGDRYLWAVSKYIENNPVRARIVKKPEDYPYSIAKAHILGRKDSLLKEALTDKNELREYRKFMKAEEDGQVLEDIRRQTRLGRPLGEEEFLQALSRKLNYDMVFRTKGRPRKLNK
jgi:putative transposase